VATLGDYIKQLSEVGNQPNERCFACESDKPSESHQCPNNPILTCNCTDNKFCAEQPNDNGWFTCPDSGKLCSIIDCPDGCKGDKPINDDKCPTHADNPVNHIGNPYPSTKGEEHIGGWPCIVIGDHRETSSKTTERICGTESSAGTTERMGNAGFSDGSYVSTND
jgi:hypothetical protein